MTPNNWHLSRRGFIQSSLTALGAAGLPLWFAREVVAQQDEKRATATAFRFGDSDRFLMGAIGIGSPKSQGYGLYRDAKSQKTHNVHYVAACDVDNNHLSRAVTQFQNRGDKEVTAYHDFRALNDRKDIAAVTIATPDPWHALVAIDAIKKGKDVYCEKPLTLTVEEALALVKVARQTGRILQTGSQQRSDPRFRLACELVFNGRVGKVQRIECRIGNNPKGTFKPSKVPEGLDWDLWLGPCPKVEYVPERCHYEFRWWYEYSGGKMTDWGAHHLDIARWALGDVAKGPVTIEATGDEPTRDLHSYNCHPRFEVTYTYPAGTKVIAMSDGENGIRFEGEDGKWLFVSREAIRASDEAIIKEPLPSEADRLFASNNHMGNFLECVKSRKRPICNVEVGASSVIMCHVGVIALRTGKKLKWDPVKNRFDDADANAMLSRPMRAPWKLEV